MTTLFIVLLILAATAAIIAQLVWWLSGRQASERVPPPLVVPIHPRFVRQPEAAFEPASLEPSARGLMPVAIEETATDHAIAIPVPAPGAVPITLVQASQAAPAALPAPDLTAAPGTETVRFVRPGDEAMQLLPARLEVVSGMAAQQVIRFVRVPGKPAEMILGREAASSPQQVTLTSSTVSRRHARVAYDSGRWLVTNLSRTNPVVVNDQALDEFEGPRALLDGDRIELGDVVLRFCTS